MICSCPAGLTARDSCSSTGKSSTQTNQGEHLARRGCSPTMFPLDTLNLAGTMVVVVQSMGARSMEDAWRL